MLADRGRVVCHGNDGGACPGGNFLDVDAEHIPVSAGQVDAGGGGEVLSGDGIAEYLGSLADFGRFVREELFGGHFQFRLTDGREHDVGQGAGGYGGDCL